jgi:hypothetical protein
MRTKLIAAADICWREVFAFPIYRARRNPWARRPWESVPSTPARRACSVAYSRGACACCLEREMVILSTHSERPPGSARALHTTGTWLAVLPGELDLDHLIGAVIYRWRPTQAGTPPGQVACCYTQSAHVQGGVVRGSEFWPVTTP